MENGVTTKVVGPKNVTELVIDVPRNIDDMSSELAEFFQLMLKKLDENSHKKTVSSDDVLKLLGKLLHECGEFTESYHCDLMDKNNELELADVANFAFLIFMVLNKQRKTTAKDAL